MKKQKSGISLIVLVITIIVIIILAVAVILSIANNNPISNANKAKFQNDVKSMQEQIELIKSKNYTDSLGASYGTINYSDLNGSEKYPGKFKVKNGELVYTSQLTGDELAWAKELGINTSAYVVENGKDGVTIEENAEGQKVFKTNWTPDGGMGDANVPSEAREELSIPDGVEVIGENALFEAMIGNVIFPSSLIKIEDLGLFSCGLKSAKLPSKLKEIGTSSFGACYNLEEVSLPNGLEKIGEAAFRQCSKLKEITIPDSVIEIGSNAFTDCEELTLTIPKSVAEKCFPGKTAEQIKSSFEIIKAVVIK